MFRTLNAAEVALWVLLAAAGAAAGIPSAGWILFAALTALLAVQVFLLRPRLDRRARQIMLGRIPPPSRLHLTYVTAETVKVPLLPVLGIVVAVSVLP